MSIKRKLSVILFLSFALVGLPREFALAEEEILTIEDLNTGEVFQFSDAELSALPQTEYATSTIWTSGVHYFSGPTLRGLLESIDREPSDLKIYAINDYNVIFPADEIEAGAPVLASRIDGEPFSVREKGPLWVVFPFDEEEAYRTERIFALSVWQVARIAILADE